MLDREERAKLTRVDKTRDKIMIFAVAEVGIVSRD